LTLKAKGSGSTFEEQFSLDSDKQFNFKNANSGLNTRSMVAIILILVVITGGIFVIRRIKD
jgi:hypothetical protein